MSSADRIDFSVLLPVYAGVQPAHLFRAIESLFEQTYPAAEIIVVEDGPLTAAQHAVIDGFEGRTPAMRRVVLPVNLGPGMANGAGLRVATSPWIAKMDADDVAVPTRLEVQAAVAATGEYDVIGSAMAEFADDERRITALRPCPRTHAQIARRMRVNNPINHPTVIYRRQLALQVGGYPDLRFLEDYDLLARMLVAGARMYNLDDALVLFRADEAMYRRRVLPELTSCERRIQRNLRDYGIIGPWRARLNLVSRLAFRRLPRPLLRLAYRVLFQRRASA